MSLILPSRAQDISHWFDPRTREPKTWVDPNTGVKMPYCPHGRYLHIPPTDPVSNWATDFGTPWWRDDQYLCGKLSKRQRKIKIVNVLSNQVPLLPRFRTRLTALAAHPSIHVPDSSIHTS